MSVVVAGIDPGRRGAVVWDGGDGCRGSEFLPYGADGYLDSGAFTELLLRLTLDFDVSVVYIEEQHPVSKQGLGSTFKTGVNYGMLVGVVSGLGMRVEVVRAKDWRSGLGIVGKGKGVVCDWVEKNMGWLDLTPGRKRVRHDGLADAGAVCGYGALREGLSKAVC